MVRTYKEVPKRAINSIRIQIEKLIKKYGEKEVRLVVTKVFEKKVQQRILKEDIAEKEKELEQLRRKK